MPCSAVSIHSASSPGDRPTVCRCWLIVPSWKVGPPRMCASTLYAQRRSPRSKPCCSCCQRTPSAPTERLRRAGPASELTAACSPPLERQRGEQIEGGRDALVVDGHVVAGGRVHAVFEARTALGDVPQSLDEAVDLLDGGAEAEGCAHGTGNIAMLAATQPLANRYRLIGADAEQI